MELGELFKEARRFGKIYIHSHDDGTYSCNITANTSKGTSLEFKSGFKNATPEEAVQNAILAAKEFINV